MADLIYRPQNTKYFSKMGKRTTEIRAVGAWVQPEPVVTSSVQHAVISAQLFEKKMQNLRLEKEARLQNFQEEVRQRVQALSRAKQQLQLEKSYRAVELERNVVKQTAHAAEKTMSRKNRCALRNAETLSIKHSGATHGVVVGDEVNEKDNSLCGQKNELNFIRDQARHRLMAKKVTTEGFFDHTDLPGGVWKTGPTLDNPMSRNLIGAHAEQDQLDSENMPTNLKEYSVEDYHNRENFAPLHPVPDVNPGVKVEEDKKQACSQRALYRRLFMDIEREQVKENIRRKEHRVKINQLKREKEADRRRIEIQAQRFTEATDPESQSDVHKEHKAAVVETKHRKAQKAKEMERYLEALRQNLKEKIEQRKVQLPPLCCCGPSVWDTNPETCANNCVFYQNPRAYAKALQSLLASCAVI